MNSPLKQLPSLMDSEDKRSFGLFMMISFLAGLIEVIGIGSIMPFIGVLMQPDLITSNRWLAGAYHALNFTEPKQFIVFLGAMTLITILAGGFINIFNVHFQLKVSYRLGHKLAVRLFATYLHQPYSYFLEANSNGMKAAILTEVDRMVTTVIIPTGVLFSKLMVVGIVFTLLLLVNPVITLLLMTVTGVIYGTLIVYFRHRMKSRGQEAVAQNAIRFQTTSEAFSSIRDIKIYNNAGFFTKKFGVASKRYCDVIAYSLYHGQVPKFIIEMTGFVLVIVLTLYLITQGTNTATDVIPLIALFAASGYKVLPAAQNIYAAVNNIRFNAASLWVVMQGMKLPAEVDSAVQPDTTLPFTQEIDIQDVTFSYSQAHKPVLKDINCTIRKNSLVGIIGPTGAGKSTFVDLLIGLLKPEHGAILIDGEPLNASNTKIWQTQIGYVPQKIYLLDDSIENNIAFGAAGSVNSDQVEAAARHAQLDSFIQTLPQGYQNPVGEHGDRLSGGQRQRIGIARALYRDPTILVLDEPTSALDVDTARNLMNTLKTLSQDKTIIIITHTVEILNYCDQVLFIDEGQIQMRKAETASA